MPGAKFSRIMVAFDGSKDSEKAIALACAMASEFSASLTVVHVYSMPTVALSAATGMPGPDYRELEDAARTAGQKVLSQGLKIGSEEGVKATGKLLEAGSVVEALVRFAEENEVDLIVVGTRGMTGFKKLLVGSVSSGLIGHAHCPVLVVR